VVVIGRIVVIGRVVGLLAVFGAVVGLFTDIY